LIVGIFVKLKAARSSKSDDKKTAQAAGIFPIRLPTHLLRRTGNIGTNPGPATTFSEVFQGEFENKVLFAAAEIFSNFSLDRKDRYS
jgi:hypothetical protein